MELHGSVATRLQVIEALRQHAYARVVIQGWGEDGSILLAQGHDGSYERITPADVRTHFRGLGTEVILCACHALRGGFAQAFLENGAEVVVTASHYIESGSAARFCCLVRENLDGSTEARVHAAKQRLRENNADDPTPLFLHVIGSTVPAALRAGAAAPLSGPEPGVDLSVTVPLARRRSILAAGAACLYERVVRHVGTWRH